MVGVGVLSVGELHGGCVMAMGEQVVQPCKFLYVRIFDFIDNIYTHSDGYRFAKVAFAYLHMLQKISV